MQNKAILFLALILSRTAFPGQPGDKRTIFTAGSRVYPIHFHLGRSTILYLGLKPETVICGNNNYFNIEKIKEGVTIQPLGNLSTNLTIMDHGRRYLFYLVPASESAADSFVDVQWVSDVDVFKSGTPANRATRVTDLNQKLKLSRGLELAVLRRLNTEGVKRQIFEIELVNKTSDSIVLSEIAVSGVRGHTFLPKQIVVWERELVKSQETLKGRLILNQPQIKPFDFVVTFRGQKIRTTIKGGA